MISFPRVIPFLLAGLLAVRARRPVLAALLLAVISRAMRRPKAPKGAVL